VVLDHEGQEPDVELGAVGGFEGGELLGGQHAGHRHDAPGPGVRRDLLVGAEPFLHEDDFGDLGLIDLPGKAEEASAGLVCRGQAGHVDGLGMVGDHALHEPDVGFGVERAFRDDHRSQGGSVRVLGCGGLGLGGGDSQPEKEDQARGPED
jgi:hypothetical protein